MTKGPQPAGVLLVRLVHGAITAFFVGCLSYIYYAAATRKRGPLVTGAVAALVVEGVVVYANGGECPLGPMHRRLGDDRTFFELLMPARLARHAVPVLGGVAALGMLLVLVRPPSTSLRSE